VVNQALLFARGLDGGTAPSGSALLFLEIQQIISETFLPSIEVSSAFFSGCMARKISKGRESVWPMSGGSSPGTEAGRGPRGGVNDGATFYVSLPQKGARSHDGVEAHTAGRG
jgi:hypothetical protein